jgi:monoamine oxidase
VRVAIIGSGISGAAAAHALHSRIGAECQITVVERETRVGGRIREQQIAGLPVEAGAAIYQSSNRLITRFVEELGLTPVVVDSQWQTVAIWDGHSFRIRGDGSSLRDGIRLLMRYRRSLPRAARLVKGMIHRLEAVYGELDSGRAWSGPEELLEGLKLRQLCREQADAFFRSHGVSERFVRELADGASRNNYGQQAAGLNAFVDLVSLAGLGLGGGRLHTLREGNSSVPAGLLEHAGVDLKLGVEVKRIAPSNHAWRLETAAAGWLDADAVVLAAPLELTGIELEAPGTSATRREFAVIHVTFVVGTLDARFFGVEQAPDSILTTEDAGSLLSIQRVSPALNGNAVFKLFSREPLGDDLLGRLFRVVRKTERLVWQAYPKLSPLGLGAAFRLAPRLYYTSAMESIVSTMETQGIAGTAVANLVCADTRGGSLPASG